MNQEETFKLFEPVKVGGITSNGFTGA